MLWWWVLVAVAWSTIAAASWALLTAAKRADVMLAAGDARALSIDIAAAAVPYVGGLLSGGAVAVVAAARESWPAGRVVAVAVGGTAADLLGCELRFDDSVVARAALSGRLEVRADAVAAPLHRAGATVGAIGFSVAPGSPESVEARMRLLDVAQAVDRVLDPVIAPGLPT